MKKTNLIRGLIATELECNYTHEELTNPEVMSEQIRLIIDECELFKNTVLEIGINEILKEIKEEYGNQKRKEDFISIKDFTNQELDEQIRNCQEQMDASEYGTGDYNCAAAELRVAEIEKKRRDKQ